MNLQQTKKLMKDAHALTNENNVAAPPGKKLKLESAFRIKEEPPDIVFVGHS